MEIRGKIIQVLDPKEGVSARSGQPWKTQDYVLETFDQYPRKMCFNVFGADKINEFAIKAGETLDVSFDIDAHEYQGRWFNSIRAWRVTRVQEGQPAQSVAGAPVAAADPFTPPTAENTENNSEPEDDLPF